MVWTEAFLPIAAAAVSTLLVQSAYRHYKRRANLLRDRIIDFVRGRPGARLADVWKELGINRGTAQYHLMMLRRAGELNSVRASNATRFFPHDTDASLVPLAAVVLRGRIREVVEMIARNPRISQSQLTASLPMSRKVFRTYADLLVSMGLIEETRDVRALRYTAKGPLDDILRMVRVAEPTEEIPPHAAQADEDAQT